MKAVVLFLAFFAQAPDGPATKPDPQYPVRVRVILTKANASARGTTGFGRGDLLEDTVRGFDFTYDCGTPFLANTGASEFYQGRWKRQDKKLEIVMQRIGSDHLDRCELQVSIKAVAYGKYGPAAGK